VGDVLVGKLNSFHVDQYKKNCPVIEVEEAYFKDKKAGAALAGKYLCLNSCGMLDKALKDVTPGEIIQIEYTGTSTIEKGPYAGKESHTMQVDIMDVVSDENTSEDEEVDL
jgi:hypothetical protein